MRSAAQILVPAKNCFFVQTLRVCGYILNAGHYFVKNATLDASAAARPAEKEPKEVYLRFTITEKQENGEKEGIQAVCRYIYS